MDCGVGKASVVDRILKFTNAKPLNQVPQELFICYAIDGIAILNK